MAICRYQNIVRNGTRFEITAYNQSKGKDLYYTEFSKNLRVGTLVTIYYAKPMSKKLGYGIIHNSSVDEYIEIEVIYVDEEFSDVFLQSKTNVRKVLQDMYVLPNMYVEYIPEVMSIFNGGVIKNAKNS